MEILVLLFGPQAALAGARSVVVTVAEPTAGAVLRGLGEACRPLAASLDGSRLAVNHGFVAADSPIAPGDEVALIGMVSGG